MSTAKEQLIKIINEIPESQAAKILDFAEYIRDKKNGELYKDLSKASESSIDFWDNEIDDEVWNDI